MITRPATRSRPGHRGAGGAVPGYQHARAARLDEGVDGQEEDQQQRDRHQNPEQDHPAFDQRGEDREQVLGAVDVAHGDSDGEQHRDEHGDGGENGDDPHRHRLAEPQRDQLPVGDRVVEPAAQHVDGGHGRSLLADGSVERPARESCQIELRRRKSAVPVMS
jgi:hypothetical protein